MLQEAEEQKEAKEWKGRVGIKQGNPLSLIILSLNLGIQSSFVLISSLCSSSECVTVQTNIVGVVSISLPH